MDIPFVLQYVMFEERSLIVCLPQIGEPEVMGSTLLSFPIYWKWCYLYDTPRKAGLLLIYSYPRCNKFI